MQKSGSINEYVDYWNQQRFLFSHNLATNDGTVGLSLPQRAIFRFFVEWPVATALPSRDAPYGKILTQLNPLSSGF